MRVQGLNLRNLLHGIIQKFLCFSHSLTDGLEVTLSVSQYFGTTKDGMLLTLVHTIVINYRHK